jgi:hypothetical protein
MQVLAALVFDARGPAPVGKMESSGLKVEK